MGGGAGWWEGRQVRVNGIALALGNSEVGHRREVLSAGGDGRAQPQQVGARDRPDTVLLRASPRGRWTRSRGGRSTPSACVPGRARPSTIRTTAGTVSRIGMKSMRAPLRRPCRTPSENQVSPRYRRRTVHCLPAGDQPPAVVRGAEERGETGAGVEAGQAEPIQRTIPADQASRVAVSDQGVVLNAQRHALALHQLG